MEVWKDIKGHEGVYQVSNYGRVKRLDTVHKNTGYVRKGHERKLSVSSSGYYNLRLSNNGILTTELPHVLVAIHFKDHVPCGYKLVINHIDHNKLNNHEDNLEIVTNRLNTSLRKAKHSSKYAGVDWHKANGNWRAAIRVNGKKKHLGYFLNEYDVHLAYKKALSEIEKPL